MIYSIKLRNCWKYSETYSTDNDWQDFERKIFLAVKEVIVNLIRKGMSRENSRKWNVFEYIAVKNGQIPSKFKGTVGSQDSNFTM